MHHENGLGRGRQLTYIGTRPQRSVDPNPSGRRMASVEMGHGPGKAVSAVFLFAKALGNANVRLSGKFPFTVEIHADLRNQA